MPVYNGSAEIRPAKMMNTQIRTSAKAILVREGKILLVRNTGQRGDWYCLPGGGQQFGETLEEAVRRECAEEVQLDVRVGPLRYVREYIGRNHEFAETDSDSHQVEFWFQCEPVGMTSGREAVLDTNQVGYEWVEIEVLVDLPMFPKVLNRLPLTEVSQPGVSYLGDIN